MADIGVFFLMMEEDKDYTSIEAKIFQFTYKATGQQLRFWAWKGDYLNLGVSAELGIGSLTPQWIVDKEKLILPMSLRLEDKEGNTLMITIRIKVNGG